MEDRNTLPPPEETTPRWPWLVGVAVVGLAIYMSSALDSPEVKAKSHQRRAIQSCWSDQQRKSLTPAAQRLAAGACERMEADFRHQYGVAP